MPVYLDENFEPVEPYVFDEFAPCPGCGAEESLYDHGCGAVGHTGYGCTSCGWGCDLDFVPEEVSRCVAAMGVEADDA